MGYVYLTMTLTTDIYIANLALISSFYDKKNRAIKIYWFMACMAMVMAILTISMNMTTNANIEIVWIKNAYKQCKFSKDVSGSYSFNQSSWIFYNLGAVFGAMDSSKKLRIGWWKNEYWKRIMRGVITSGIAYGIYYGFSSIKTYDNTTEYVFNYAVSVFICAYLSFGIMPLVFEKVKLNLREDLAQSFATGISMNALENE